MHQAGHRKLQFPDDGILFFNLHAVRFHQGITEIGHVLIPDPVPIQGIESDPCPHLRVIVSQHAADVPITVGQLFNKLPGRAVPAPLGGHIFSVFFKTLGHIPDVFRGVKQGFQVEG